VERAGWDAMAQIYREFTLRAGRVVVRGCQARRDASTVLRADYALLNAEGVKKKSLASASFCSERRFVLDRT
jgi:type I restriction enzyme R subunit